MAYKLSKVGGMPVGFSFEEARPTVQRKNLAK